MTSTRRRRAWAAIALCLLLPPGTSRAHPLGNDSVTHINIVWILPDRVELDLFLDFAEGPSRGFPDEIDTNNDGEESTEEHRVWLQKKSGEIAPALHVTIDGQPVPLRSPPEVRDPNTGRAIPSIPGLIKIPGAAGQPTYRALIRFAGSFPTRLTAGEHVLHYEDASFGQYNGLRRIVLEKVPGIACLPPHPEFLDVEGTAFIYDFYDPANLPQEREATVRFRVLAGPVAAGTGPRPEGGSPGDPGTAPSPPQDADSARPAREPEPRAPDQASLPYPILDPRNDPARLNQSNQQAQHLIGLLQGPWGWMVFLTVTVLAFGWGAMHALMPGHAKTVVAAYLISQRGNYWHAVVLAIVVTVTHTALVVIVGLVIWLYQKSHPGLGASLQLWLGVVAGLLVAGMGIMLVWRALTGRIAHHHHDHAHDHEERSWFRKLFTHSHPHVQREESRATGDAAEQGTVATIVEHGGSAGTASALHQEHPHSHAPGHKHNHPHERGHGHAHAHPDAHEHSHAREPSHPHGHSHAHDHQHPHTHGHTHGHSHDHAHHDGHAHAHTHPHGHHGSPRAAAERPLTLRMLLLLGITGGIVPCPTATIILLLGISANVVTGALYAVGVFSLGLALTLMLIGFAALFSRRFAARVMADASHEGELSSTGRRLLLQAVPAVSGALVTLLGAGIAINYLYYMVRGTSLFPWLG